MARKKETHVIEEETANARNLTLDEIGDPGPIETVGGDALRPGGAVELEKFMNEYVNVIVHPDASDNAVEIPIPQVNGVNQPFIRGKVQRVKRKYVEALVHAVFTRYKQATPDPRQPENIQMLATSAPVYPFTVVSDPNPAGPAWLEAIKAQQNQ